jgi:DNA-binding FadR family transcriptional regulator
MSVDHLGRLIVTSRPGYRPGQVVSLEMVSGEAGVSRAMAREVLQVLHQKRLVRLQPRVGATVLPVEQWDPFDPDVIKWRIDVAPRFQIRSLTEMRQAIEPMAARLSAERASADVCRDLVTLSQQLHDHGRDDLFGKKNPEGNTCRDRYRAVDEEFHRTLLKGSQNEMLYALADPVAAALNYRIEQDWEGAHGPGAGTGGNKPFPVSPSPLALWLHRGLATAVEQGCPSAAESFSRAILFEVRAAPFPLAYALSLEVSLSELDLRALAAEGKPFQEAIMSAVQYAKEGPS